MTAGDDVEAMRAQIYRYHSIMTKQDVLIREITGTADDPGQKSGIASKTDKGFDGYNGTWEVGNWGDTLKLTKDDKPSDDKDMDFNSQRDTYKNIYKK